MKNIIVFMFLSLFFCGCAAVKDENPIVVGQADKNGSVFHFPAKQITTAPGWHWFAYYDKLQTDPTQRYILTMTTNFEGRSPTPADVIEIGMVDAENNFKYIKLGESHAWGWQQGCQLQFIPGSKNEVIWNDKEGDKFISRILNIETKKMRTLPMPVYALSPDGKFAVTTDYRRINDTRPGYGYAGIPDPNAKVDAPDNSGIWRMDLTSGEVKLIIPLSKIAAIENPLDADAPKTAKHWFNHLLIGPDGKRFIFLHRWKHHEAKKNAPYKRVGGFGTRMITANSGDGGDIRIIDPYNYTSHFIWDNKGNVLAWTKIPEQGQGFFLIEDKQGGKITHIGKDVMVRNGHNTYLPNKWNLVLNDTYPDEKTRLQSVYVYNTDTKVRTPVADLYSPPAYKGEWRCDTHPRASAKGDFILVDSPHNNGRQIYMIDIRNARF